MLKHIFCGFLILSFFLFARISHAAIAFYHYGTEKGLTESSIVNINQDSVGFIWLAGDYSLTRFDGNNFSVFKNTNYSSFPWNKINIIHTDSEGILWVGSDTGISKYDFLKNKV